MPKQSYAKPVSETKANYHAYLESPEWDSFKKKKEAQVPKSCIHCGSIRIVQLHHMIYRDTPQESRLEDTVWLCQMHHMALHRSGIKSMKRSTHPSVLVEKTLKALRACDERKQRKQSIPVIKVHRADNDNEIQARAIQEERLLREIESMERGLVGLRQKLESIRGGGKIKKMSERQVKAAKEHNFNQLLKAVKTGSVLK